ncbi:efflux RND transporter periplasmic adaptor subunit [Candidatus Venteria ishoeyi]|uniref:Macrolide export protein MacA n=1 Tax=Candidatus Venteria ishoeyi TaxID=1899563 RepID=A0A1H6FCP3_9GAMM|nr:efflux RND transporter periplasmic adaptor subunit [Candidatus Venteria ishoeyi]SEH06926.1 Macrolide export protein MacA [Candidatus Venteria ishoeyi]
MCHQKYKIGITAGFLFNFLFITTTQAEQVVRIETVKLQQLQQHKRVTGNLRALSEASLAVRESGYVAKVLVNEGTRVKAGDMLVQLDERRLRSELAQLKAELSQAKAAVRQRQAELANAKVEMEANQYSANKKAISQRALRLSKTQFNVAQAALQEAKAVIAARNAQLQLLQVRLADLTLYAPFAGLITERLAEPGEWFKQGQNVITLVADAQLEAWLDVPERFVHQLNTNPQQKINLQINGRHLEAGSQVILGKVDPHARTFTLVAHFDNTEQHWMPGMSVLAWLPLAGQQAVLTVSKNALVQRNGKYTVFKVSKAEEGDTASAVAVEVLFYQDGRAAIKAMDLAENDRVVNEGNERLNPGAVLVTKIATDDKSVSLAELKTQQEAL